MKREPRYKTLRAKVVPHIGTKHKSREVKPIQHKREVTISLSFDVVVDAISVADATEAAYIAGEQLAALLIASSKIEGTELGDAIKCLITSQLKLKRKTTATRRL